MNVNYTSSDIIDLFNVESKHSIAEQPWSPAYSKSEKNIETSKIRKSHKKLKSKFRKDSSPNQAIYVKCSQLNPLCLKANSLEVIDTVKHQTGIISELLKIDNPNSLCFKPKSGESTESGCKFTTPSDNSDSESSSCTSETTLLSQNKNNIFPFSLDEIDLPPEPNRNRIIVPERTEVNNKEFIKKTKCTEFIKTQSQSKDFIKKDNGSKRAVIIPKKDNIDPCKLKTLPNNLPLPKVNITKSSNSPTRNRTNKYRIHRPPLPLPNVPSENGKLSSTKSIVSSHIKKYQSVNNTRVCSEQPAIKRPRVCEMRSKSRNNKTWGERSVNSFKFLEKVGEGTYGHVFKASDLETGELKALKKVRLENEKEGFPITAIREIKILRQLSHANIVNLGEIITDINNPIDFMKDKGSFYLVFDYMDHDLFGILDAKSVISEEQVASIFKQLLEGINYCHNKNFLHRDIKCSNILVNNKGEIKIADFGLARIYAADDKQRPYTNRVTTLWYRPPELLLGEECYGPGIDIWSLGCILGELFTGHIMFTSNEEMEQLEAISKVCGVPNVYDWPKVARLSGFESFKPRFKYKRRIRELYSTLPYNALDLLDCMLKMDPDKRCSAQQALKCDWLRLIDPSKIRPPDFPKDRDCHELLTKNKHKLMRQERELKAHKMGMDLNADVTKQSTCIKLEPPVKEDSCDADKVINVHTKVINEAISKFMPNVTNIIKSILEQIPKESAMRDIGLSNDKFKHNSSPNEQVTKISTTQPRLSFDYDHGRSPLTSNMFSDVHLLSSHSVAPARFIPISTNRSYSASNNINHISSASAHDYFFYGGNDRD